MRRTANRQEMSGGPAAALAWSQGQEPACGCGAGSNGNSKSSDDGK